MHCSKETLARLFYSVSGFFLLLLIFVYFTSILLVKLLQFCGTPIIQRNQDEYDFSMSSEEEEENGFLRKECKDRDHLVANLIRSGDSPQLMPTGYPPKVLSFEKEVESYFEPMYDETEEDFRSPMSASKLDGEEEVLGRDTESIRNFGTDCWGKSDFVTKFETPGEIYGTTEVNSEKARTKFTRDENFLILPPPRSETKKLKVQGKDILSDEEIFGDSCTVGSTSKSSSEWRSSTNCRDSGMEDPFSSSSRRSCPKWESYTVFQKYDEEMLFLDRISVQKLHETESLRSIQACPRSVSERIVHMLSTRNKNSTSTGRNPCHELEAAYVAQICLTWEALKWNYKYFQRLRASSRETDPGCPAYIAQQLQQFLVLLQRYVENEPYDHGRRPEIYARARSVAPKLLQVPEYRDSNDEEREGSICSIIPSDSFLLMMKESIRTFMKFLKADRESHCQILADFFRRKRRNSVDPTRLLQLKKVNKQKKLKLQDLARTRKCLRRRKLKQDEEMEILMALIDTKMVSRVLRMTDLTEEQLQWCDDKMKKVKVADGKMQIDSSPIFFPTH